MLENAKNLQHQQRINEALLHIQDHLGSRLTLECLAKVACLSSYHFHRIFTAHVGETLHHHVCRLRMDRSAFKLRYGKDAIADIALSIGYETPAAFAKGFKQHFGVTPSQYRVQPINDEILPRNLSSENSLLGSIYCNLPAEIQTLPEQSLLFIRKTGYYYQVAQEAWSALMPYAYQHLLVNEQTQFIGITHDDPEITAAEKIRYDACLSLGKLHQVAGKMGLQRLAGGRYARFLHVGSYQTMRASYQKIYGGWLPSSGHRLRDLPSFSAYLPPHHDHASEQCETAIYIPIE